MSLTRSSDTTSSKDIFYAHSRLNQALITDAVPAHNAGRGRIRKTTNLHPFAQTLAYPDEPDPANPLNAAIH